MNQQTENDKKLKEFFNNEYNSLKQYVGSKIKTSINLDPEDLIQDVALKLFAGADRSLPINNVAGLVYRAVKNKIIDLLRTKKQNSVDAKDQNELKIQEFADIIYGKADNSYSEEMINILKQEIINLKPIYRDVILAIDFEGYTYQEITENTNIPKGTLMARRHRALGELNKKLRSKNNINN